MPKATIFGKSIQEVAEMIGAANPRARHIHISLIGDHVFVLIAGTMTQAVAKEARRMTMRHVMDYLARWLIADGKRASTGARAEVIGLGMAAIINTSAICAGTVAWQRAITKVTRMLVKAGIKCEELIRAAEIAGRNSAWRSHFTTQPERTGDGSERSGDGDGDGDGPDQGSPGGPADHPGDSP